MAPAVPVLGHGEAYVGLGGVLLALEQSRLVRLGDLGSDDLERPPAQDAQVARVVVLRRIDQEVAGPVDQLDVEVVGESGDGRLVVCEWGRGYATEAAGAVVDWALSNLPGEVVLARVRPGNLASQGVARKVGLVRDPSFDDQGEDGLDWAFTSRSAQG